MNNYIKTLLGYVLLLTFVILASGIYLLIKTFGILTLILVPIIIVSYLIGNVCSEDC